MIAVYIKVYIFLYYFFFNFDVYSILLRYSILFLYNFIIDIDLKSTFYLGKLFIVNDVQEV